MLFKNKTTIATSLLLILSFAFSLVALPAVNAHTPPWTVPTSMYVNVSPNPTGVGQRVFVNLWLNTPPPTDLRPPYPDLWQNMTVVVKTPDGKTERLGPFTADPSGGTAVAYIPSVVGNYTFQSFFGGQTLNPNPPPGTPPSNAAGDYYQPSESRTFTLTVQEEPIPGPFVNPLPTTYWSRPIYATNNNWYSIGGNWLALQNNGLYNATGNYAPYTLTPTTAHILWTKPEAFGGTIGGEFGDSLQSNFYSTRQYEVMFMPIIINGVLYYTQYPVSATNPAGFVAADLRTGRTLWTTNYPLAVPPSTKTPTDIVPTAGPSTILRAGQILNYYSPNQYGGLAYLWSTGTPAMVASATKIGAGTTTYNMFDAMTGNYILSIVNGTAFLTLDADEHGDLIGYFINASNPNAQTLNKWNSTKAILKYNTLDLFQIIGLEVWRPPQGGIIPFDAGIEWTVPLVTNVSGVPINLGLSGFYNGYAGLSSDVILLQQYGLLGNGTVGYAFQAGWIVQAGYSAVNGRLLWGPVNRTENFNTRVSYGQTGNGNAGFAIGDGAWVETDLNAMTVTGYNLYTGEKVWGPKELPNAQPLTSLGVQQIVANGTIYIWTYGGDVYSINIHTGAINWQRHSPPAGMENPYGVNALWTARAGVIGNDLLFLAEGHEFVPPLYHGAHLLAFNTTNGQMVWNITGFFTNGVKAIVDGILVGINAYDNQIYAFGKGPSKTTVTAPSVGVTTATPIAITGSVYDISAGSQQQAVAANFPNGLPVVSDSSQTKFMEAVYMQQPMPNDITGVPITLYVIDSNNNYRQIGSTTSNAMGTYGFTWTPDIPGNYTVIAIFAGSKSYYGSSAQTYFYASEVTTAPAPESLQPIDNGLTIVGVGVAILIAIAIVGAVLIMMLRKR